MKFTKLATGWITTESKPTYHGWPTLCVLSDGRLLAAASGGRERHICPFGRVYLYESCDGGCTWSEPRILTQGPLDDRDCGIVEAADGSILINYFTSIAFTREVANGVPPSWQPAMDSITLETLRKEHGFWMIRSTDGGKTWSEKYAVPVNNVHGPTLLNDGSLMWIGRERGHFIDNSCMGLRVKAFRSTDNGLTWELVATMPEVPGQDQRTWHEVDTVQMEDGRLITQIRNQYAQTCIADIATWQTESFDLGRTWRPYHEVSRCFPTDLVRLKDGLVVMTGGCRQKPYGIRFRVGPEIPVRHWSDEMILSDDDISYDSGYPSTVQLPDGTLVTLWYSIHPELKIAQLRWLKWKLD
ncbi:MAG: exo-alpha-sialidase [Lentisphaeria bacterium]|nr:exo-alpha-sialidase [Lentisphaeria bacterium]